MRLALSSSRIPELECDGRRAGKPWVYGVDVWTRDVMDDGSPTLSNLTGWARWRNYRVSLKKTEYGMREPLVKIYKGTNNGSFAITTTASNLPEFFGGLTGALMEALTATDTDQEFTLDSLLPQICSLYAKMSGYKAEEVTERRMLITGEPNPEAHMRCLNAPEAQPA